MVCASKVRVQLLHGILAIAITGSRFPTVEFAEDAYSAVRIHQVSRLREGLECLIAGPYRQP